MTQAHAMVFEEPYRLRQSSFDIPSLQSGEVLVRTRLCTLCGSDLHTYEGRRTVETPQILGHEIIGTVEAVGGNVHTFDGQLLRTGDRVVWSICVSCGTCRRCTRGLPQKCQSIVKYGHAAITAEYALSGGLATHCHLLPGTAIYKVPDELADEVAAPAMCATATIAAAMRQANNLSGSNVLIQGAGMLGLTAAAMAREGKANRVVVCDVDTRRLEQAMKFGACDTILLPMALEAVRSQADVLTTGEGFDVIFEVSGARSAIAQGMTVLAVGGCYLWLGAVFPSEPLALAPDDLIRRHLMIHGVHNYRPEDLARAIEFLRDTHSKYPFAGLVERVFAFEQATSAFDHAIATRPVRVGVRMMER